MNPCLHFTRALSGGDLGQAASCFARDGCLITPDATAVHGRDRIRSVLSQLVAQRTRIEVEFSHAVEAGEVVLARERWRVRYGDGGGRLPEQVLDPMLVLRQAEGEWKLAIAAPWTPLRPPF